MDCTLQPTGRVDGAKHEYTCPMCRVNWFVRPSARLHRACVPLAERAGPCLYRGLETRRVLCPTCAGKVQVKVFACALHGECTIEKPADGLMTCRGCPDFAPAEPGLLREAWRPTPPTWLRGLAVELQLDIPAAALPAELSALAGCWCVRRGWETFEADGGHLVEWWYCGDSGDAVLVTATVDVDGRVTALRAALLAKCRDESCGHPGCFVDVADWRADGLSAVGQLPMSAELLPTGGQAMGPVTVERV